MLVEATCAMILCSRWLIKRVLGLVDEGIDASRIVGVQLPQSIDQGFGSGRALPRGIADRMVPNKCRDAGLEEERAYRGDTGFQREFRSVPEIEDTFFLICRRRYRMDQRPAPIKNRSPQVFRDVNRVEIGRAEG